MTHSRTAIRKDAIWFSAGMIVAGSMLPISLILAQSLAERLVATAGFLSTACVMTLAFYLTRTKT